MNFAYFARYDPARTFSDNTPGAGLPTTGTTMGQFGSGMRYSVAYPSAVPQAAEGGQGVVVYPTQPEPMGLALG